MHFKHILITIIFSLFLVSQTTFAGDTESVRAMANIMMHLNHYPSDAEKQQLANIAKTSSSESVKVVATALINMEHSATDADKQKLQTVMNDPNADKNIKTLASIVRNVLHKPSSADKEQLQAMISFAGN
jgi:hypothetical protein